MKSIVPGRICLVTGASSGIGAETALALAASGYRVGIVGRDEARTEEAAARIRAQTGAHVDVFLADLSVQAEIRRLAGEVAALYPRLDLLVNNAGAIFSEFALTVDGIERTWALDHLAYIQLTLALRGLLQASAPARIVNVASAAHRRARIDIAAIESGGFNTIQVYSRAKLGNLLFTYALARRLEGSGITVNALHPGVIASRFASETGGLFGFGWRLMRPFLASSENGARTTIHVATAPELEGVSGRYFIDRKEAESSAHSRDIALQESVYAYSLKQLGLAE